MARALTLVEASSTARHAATSKPATQAAAIPIPTPGDALVSTMRNLARLLRQQGSTLGPLSVLAILVVYVLIGPHLPEGFREYVYRILH